MGCQSHTCLPHSPVEGSTFPPRQKTGVYKVAGYNCFSAIAFRWPGHSTIEGAEQDTHYELIKVLEELEELLSYHQNN